DQRHVRVARVAVQHDVVPTARDGRDRAALLIAGETRTTVIRGECRIRAELDVEIRVAGAAADREHDLRLAGRYVELPVLLVTGVVDDPVDWLAVGQRDLATDAATTIRPDRGGTDANSGPCVLNRRDLALR